jgi:hypothetical protein
MIITVTYPDANEKHSQTPSTRASFGDDSVNRNLAARSPIDRSSLCQREGETHNDSLPYQMPPTRLRDEPNFESTFSSYPNFAPWRLCGR